MCGLQIIECRIPSSNKENVLKNNNYDQFVRRNDKLYAISLRNYRTLYSELFFVPSKIFFMFYSCRQSFRFIYKYFIIIIIIICLESVIRFASCSVVANLLNLYLLLNYGFKMSTRKPNSHSPSKTFDFETA